MIKIYAHTIDVLGGGVKVVTPIENIEYFFYVKDIDAIVVKNKVLLSILVGSLEIDVTGQQEEIRKSILQTFHHCKQKL